MKEYSKGIYVKFKPEEVEILHDRMKEAGVHNMSAYIRKMAINGYVIIPEWPDLNRVISLNPKADCLLSICDALDITPEQLLTGKGIDPEYKDADMDYEVTRSDIKILKQIHSLGDDQYKRLMAYMKALQKLEQMESMVEE